MLCLTLLQTSGRMAPKRLRLSFLVHQTKQLLLVVLGSIALMLGLAYLFLLNNSAMSGYVLSVESESHETLARQVEQLDALIASRERREFLAETDAAKIMIPTPKPQYFVVRDLHRAQVVNEPNTP